jgi:type VI secretion system protein ImpB
MAGESVHKKKERVRPPRVHITYEVETLDGLELKELPFVAGVMADLSGNPAEQLPKLRDRKFVDVDRDNFDDVMASMAPRLAFKVDNRLKDDGSQLSVEFNFGKLDDFSPDAVAKQVQPMAELLDVRGKLKDLLSRTEGNDRLEEMLTEIIRNQEVQGKLQAAVGQTSEAPAAAGAPTEAADSPDESPAPEGSEEK